MADMRYFRAPGQAEVWINPAHVVLVYKSDAGSYMASMSDGKTRHILAKDAERLLPNDRKQRTKKSVEV